MGLHLLLRASGLAVGETKPKRMLIIDPAMLQQWNSLNATERYMSLLESWLLKETVAGKAQTPTRDNIKSR